MAVETNARIEFSVASVEEWEKVNPKLHQGEPVFAKKPSGKYILKVGAPGGSTYKNAVVVWDQDDAETKMTSTQEAAAQALASKNAASASASAAAQSASAAAKSAIDAAKFDPSSYYLKSEVDNKIDAVWKIPLNWDIISNNSIMNATSILYDSNGIPARYQLGFLATIITENIYIRLNDYALKTDIPKKTSQLTNDSGFAVISNGHLVINGSELWIE